MNTVTVEKRLVTKPRSYNCTTGCMLMAGMLMVVIAFNLYFSFYIQRLLVSQVKVDHLLDSWQNTEYQTSRVLLARHLDELLPVWKEAIVRCTRDLEAFMAREELCGLFSEDDIQELGRKWQVVRGELEFYHRILAGDPRLLKKVKKSADLLSYFRKARSAGKVDHRLHDVVKGLTHFQELAAPFEKMLRAMGEVVDGRVEQRMQGFRTVSVLLCVIVGILSLLLMGMMHRRRVVEKERDSLFKLSTDMLSISGIDGCFRQVNPAWRRTLGWSEEELLNKPWVDFIHADERPKAREVEEVLRKGRAVYGFEARFLCRDGSYRWLFWNCIPMRSKQRVISVVRDVTQERESERALREEHTFRNAIIENMTEGVCVARPCEKRPFLFFTVWNSRMAEITGCSREDINRSGWYRLLNGDGKQRRKAFRAMERIARGEHLSRELWEITRPDGHKRTLSISTTTLQENHEATHILAVIHDVTDRCQTEAALKESEEKYRMLVSHAKDAIFIVQDEVIHFPNPMTLDLLGYSAEELAAMPWIEHVHPDDRIRVKEHQKKILQGLNSEETFFFRLVDRKGRQRWGELKSAAVLWEGAPATLNFIRDVSAQKQLEAQLVQAQKMEAIGTLAGGIAHDFNNLLQAIQGYAELITLKYDNPKARRELGEIVRASQRARDLTSQLLTFSRKVESRRKPIDLNHEVNQVISLLERTLPKMIEIEVCCADTVSAVNADPGQLEQVLINLAINAKDAMAEGGTLLIETKDVVLDEHYCRTHLGSRPGRYVLLAVSDTGHGMDRGTVQHIFEPFYTTKRAGEGTGLGLAMVYGIVKNHDGYITCYSEPGLGTTFKIYLPALEQKNISSQPLEDESQLPRGKGETILLVDDEAFIRELGHEVLKNFDYRVLTAASGEEALETYRGRPDEIDLIVLDLIMPGMGGNQCLRRILELDPRARIVVASGFTANGPREELLQMGASDFITKPYEMRQMLTTIRNVIDSGNGRH